MIRILTALFLALPSLAQAQSWPVHENTFINDYANIVDDAAETRIRRQLEVLRQETGVEATVLTLFTRWGYENAGSFEDFATGLFNAWGIGNAERNDGILILVVSEDRDMRIELGAGYPRGFDREAKDIIDRVFIPAFQAGNLSDGIEDGTDATIARIARVHAAGEAAAEPPGAANPVGWIAGAIVAIFGSIIGVAMFGRRIRDRLTRCPSCGRRGIRSAREVLDKATRKKAGRGEKTITCPYCNYHDTHIYTISRITASSSSGSSSGGSFGGGSSSGGGASGSW